MQLFDVTNPDDLAEKPGVVMVLEPRRQDDHEKLKLPPVLGGGINHSQDTGFAEIEAPDESIRNRLFQARRPLPSRSRRNWIMKSSNDDAMMENRAIP